jgi:hypothetical protein
LYEIKLVKSGAIYPWGEISGGALQRLGPVRVGSVGCAALSSPWHGVRS